MYYKFNSDGFSIEMIVNRFEYNLWNVKSRYVNDKYKSDWVELEVSFDSERYSPTKELSEKYGAIQSEVEQQDFLKKSTIKKKQEMTGQKSAKLPYTLEEIAKFILMEYLDTPQKLVAIFGDVYESL